MSVVPTIVAKRPNGERANIVQLGHRECVIGRKGQIRLYLPQVSTRHCMLQLDSEQCAWITNYSKNGTIVNDHVLGVNERLKLEPGDKIQIASREFYYELAPASPSTSATRRLVAERRLAAEQMTPTRSVRHYQTRATRSANRSVREILAGRLAHRSPSVRKDASPPMLMDQAPPESMSQVLDDVPTEENNNNDNDDNNNNNNHHTEEEESTPDGRVSLRRAASMVQEADRVANALLNMPVLQQENEIFNEELSCLVEEACVLANKTADQLLETSLLLSDMSATTPRRKGKAPATEEMEAMRTPIRQTVSTPAVTSARRTVTWGPSLRPEVFDPSAPPATPLCRGDRVEFASRDGTPRSALRRPQPTPTPRRRRVALHHSVTIGEQDDMLTTAQRVGSSLDGDQASQASSVGLPKRRHSLVRSDTLQLDMPADDTPHLIASPTPPCRVSHHHDLAAAAAAAAAASSTPVQPSKQPSDLQTPPNKPEVADESMREATKTPFMPTAPYVAEPEHTTPSKELCYTGVRELLKTPKSAPEPNYVGVRELLKTPQTASEVNYVGLRRVLKTPSKKPEANYVGVRELMQTPAPPANSPSLVGVRQLFRTPTQAADTSFDGDGLADLFKTPPTAAASSTSESATEPPPRPHRHRPQRQTTADVPDTPTLRRSCRAAALKAMASIQSTPSGSRKRRNAQETTPTTQAQSQENHQSTHRMTTRSAARKRAAPPAADETPCKRTRRQTTTTPRI